MNQENIEKNQQEFCTTKILIPAYNDYLLKDMRHWIKKAYHQVYIKVGWRKAKKMKETMPIETAAYAEDKVFGNWRLVAPDGPGKISPLQQVIELLRRDYFASSPHLSPKGRGKGEGMWGEFRRKFICELKLCFNAICDADYPIRDPVRDDPTMVDEVNGRLNQLLNEYTNYKDGVAINFVLKPETVEDYSSLKNLTIRSAIWMRWTGVPLDFTQFIKPPGTPPLCRLMEMELVLKL